MGLLSVVKSAGRVVAKSPLGKVAVAAATVTGGPLAGAAVSASVKKVANSGNKTKAKKSAASKAATAHSSTTTAVNDNPGEGEKARTAPKGFIDSILAMFGLA